MPAFVQSQTASMKNPFNKENNSGLIIGAIVAGTLAAGAGIWFYLRGKRAAEAAAYHREHAQDYLKKKQKKKKKHRSDINDLENVIRQEHQHEKE
jgi:uncharacterized protein HemX